MARQGVKGWLVDSVMLFVFGSCLCDAGENLSVAVMGSYTTSTRFIFNVDQPDESINDRYFNV